MSAAGFGYETALDDNDQGRRILNADRETAVHYVLASVIQARHWESQLRRILAKATNCHLRANFVLLPGGAPARTYHRHAIEVIRTLLRRNLPLSNSDCAAILDWVLQLEPSDLSCIPLNHILRAIQRLSKSTEINTQLVNRLVRLVDLLYRSPDPNVVKHATLAKQISDNRSKTGASDRSLKSRTADSVIAVPVPTVVGMPGVLLQLKRLFGIP